MKHTWGTTGVAFPVAAAMRGFRASSSAAFPAVKIYTPSVTFSRHLDPKPNPCRRANSNCLGAEMTRSAKSAGVEGSCISERIKIPNFDPLEEETKPL